MTADVWSASYARAEGQRYWPCEELVRFAGRRRHQLGETVLEVGCGNGANLWFIAQHAGRVDGLDACNVAVHLARVYCEARGVKFAEWSPVKVTHGDAFSMPYEAGRFDGVVDCMTSQHVKWQDHRRLYEEYRRVLKPGGWLFLYHLDSGTSGASGEAYENGGPYDHDPLALFPTVGLTCCPPPSGLKRVLRLAGFTVAETRGLCREYPDGQRAHYTVIEATAS